MTTTFKAAGLEWVEVTPYYVNDKQKISVFEANIAEDKVVIILGHRAFPHDQWIFKFGRLNMLSPLDAKSKEEAAEKAMVKIRVKLNELIKAIEETE